MQAWIQRQKTGEVHELVLEKSLPVGFLCESESYRIEIDFARNEQIDLFVGDDLISPRKIIHTQFGQKCEWLWTVEYYAGQTCLIFAVQEVLLLIVPVDIAPHPGKLGREEYQELLIDLQKRAAGGLFGETPARVRLKREERKTPSLASYFLLQAHAARLERLFHQIQLSPHCRLQAIREEQRLQKVRRVDTHTMTSSLRRIPVLEALNGDSFIPVAWQEPLVNVPRRVETCNTAPNRYLLATFLKLIQLCTRLQSLFSERAADDNLAVSTRTRIQRYEKQVDYVRKSFDRARKTDLLKGLKPQRADSEVLVTISRHPNYARFDRIANEILTPALSLGDDPAQTLTLKNTFQLYEYWTLFSIADALAAAFPSAKWESKIKLADSNGFLNLSGGCLFHGEISTGHAALYFQKQYNRGEATENRPHSISRQCNPDFLIEIRHKLVTRRVILDAKYRTSSDSIMSGLDDMHVYRDAIRNSDGTPAIDAAFILTPPPSPDVAKFYTDDYRLKHHFGAFVLTPGNPESQRVFAAALARILYAQ